MLLHPARYIKKKLKIAGIMVAIIVVGLIVTRLILNQIKPELAERPFFGLYFWYHTRWFYPINSFLQEIFIRLVMLSIATYMGVSSASVNLENGANDFYKNSNFYDLEVVSTLLLSESDVDAISGLDSVETVVPFYFTNAGCEHNNEKQNVNILTTAE